MLVSVREFGCLGTVGESRGLDYQVIPLPAFEALRRLALEQSNGDSPLLQLRIGGGHECLQALNYVGLLETAEGVRVEVLPKTTAGEESAVQARRILWRMLSVVLDVPYVRSRDSTVDTLTRDWLEVLIGYALSDIGDVIRRGLCREYVRQEDRPRYLKGQLQVARQIRRPPGQLDRLDVRYDRYVADRPENRLIRSTLSRLRGWSRYVENQRKTRDLSFLMDDVPPSQNVRLDLRAWSDRRELAHYRRVRPWVELIMNDQAPVFAEGAWGGVSLLFPMEGLFERYVEQILRRQMAGGYRLRAQAASRYLATHHGRRWFQLRPDLVVACGQSVVSVLDTKWKLLDQNASDTRSKYNIREQDVYQLYAYGRKYLDGAGDVFLVYPAHERFSSPLPVFDYDQALRLWCVPFDMREERLMLGEWVNDQDWYQPYQLTRSSIPISQPTTLSV